MIKKQFFSLCCSLLATIAIFGQSNQPRQVALSDFQMQTAALVKETPELISNNNYHIDSTAYWFPVKVPCTVLTGLVRNRIYPDPYSGLNNMLIPDASDSFNKRYDLAKYSFLPGHQNPWQKPYWYRTVFRVPAQAKDAFYQLIFKGINYRADVWLNGKQVADSSQIVGMFAEYNFDITHLIKREADNVLAVLVYPLDFPGEPSTEQLRALGDFYPNGGPTGDIGKNVTMLCSVGWDWIPPVRDRNMGIWEPVYLRSTGAVTIGRTQIRTELPALPDTSTARILLNLSVNNHAGETRKSRLVVNISPENFAGNTITFSKDLETIANGSTEISLSPGNVPSLLLHKPKLWWPNGYGKPNLYRVQLRLINGNTVLDDTSFVFGVRTVSSTAETVQGFVRRTFFVNGKKVHLVGGAWVPDMMLNRTAERLDKELRLCQNANINLVRIWGGGTTPSDEFFELSDKYGLLIWQDFWVTGDTQGEFKGSPDWPFEGSVFVRNVTSTILRIRNHPSLLVWTGGNEGHARKELYEAMRNSVIRLDGTRPFIPSSSGFARLPEGWAGSWPDNQPSGVYSGGPYAWRDPAEYYKLVNNKRDWVFKDETGLPSQPPYNSLRKIIPDLVWDTALPFPLNNTWGYHDACTGAGRYDNYYREMEKRFGAPGSLRDFSTKMQLLNAEGYQGIFEAANHKLNETGGVMLWKINAAFPSVIWQIYDWYLEPNAGYYFMQNACEALHVQCNRDDSSVLLVNRGYTPLLQLSVSVDVYNTSGTRLWHQVLTTDINGEQTRRLASLAGVISSSRQLCFVVLNVKDEAGRNLSHNAYWLAPDNNYKELFSMKPAAIAVKAIATSAAGGRERAWKVYVRNESSNVATFLNCQLFSAGEEVMPSYWTANYITLAPGESAVLELKAPSEKLNEKDLSITLDGINVQRQTIKL